jgi:hypothetical protein
MLSPCSAQPAQEPPAGPAYRQTVAYVADFRDPSLLVLADRVGIRVSPRTEYWVQPARGGKLRRGTINDVTIETKVRVVIGPDRVAKAIIVIQGR